MLKILKLIASPVFKVLFSVEYHGLDNVPKKGAVILAGNHPSYLDPILIALPIDRVIRFMAWDALFKIPLLGSLIRSLGAFPVDIRRGKGDSAYREACRVLMNGDALGIFPEGQRSENGPLGDLRTGTARLALETGATIIPITIGGAFRAWPRWRLIPKPAKIIVRYHQPLIITEGDRQARAQDREFQNQVMTNLARQINRSLTPALRGDTSFERLYRQPPAHLRIYEWAPLVAALVASLLLWRANTLAAHWLKVWLPVVCYYLYLAADLTLIRPGREAKWLRNSMPVWLILAWHYPLTRALGIPAGEQNLLLAILSVSAFFAFFWEDYYTLQKFVRGLVVVYYISMLFLLIWPEPPGMFVSVAVFILAFSIWYRTLSYRITALVFSLSLSYVLYQSDRRSPVLFLFAGLGVAAIAYLQTFINAAYDIRKNGLIAAPEAEIESKARG